MRDVILSEWIFEVHARRDGTGPIWIRTENVRPRDAAFVGYLARLAELWLMRRRKSHA